MLRRISKIIAVVLIILGVAAFLFHDSRLAAHIRFAEKAHKPSVDADFNNLPKVVPSKSASITEAFPGLPHNFHDTEAFIHELWTSKNQSIHGYRFYAEPLEFSDDFKQFIHGLLTEQSTFTAYGGPKLCGGYHADLAVRLDDEGKEYIFLICFGCREILCFTDGAELISDLDDDASERLRAAWLSEKIQQPATRPEQKLEESEKPQLDSDGYSQ